MTPVSSYRRWAEYGLLMRNCGAPLTSRRMPTRLEDVVKSLYVITNTGGVAALAGEAKYFNQTAWRTLAVLDRLSRTEGGLSLTELARALECSKSSLFPILKTMEQSGYVTSGVGAAVYVLTPRIYELVRQHASRQSYSRAFGAVSRRVVSEVQETMQMAVLDGTDIVYVAKRESDQPVRLVSDVGLRLPGYATALGKCLLAHLDPSEVRERFAHVDMTRLTARTVRTVDELLAALDRIRSEGVAEDWQEVSEGLCCISAPVHLGTGDVAAAVSFAVPLHRATPDHWAELRVAIVRAATEMSHALGYEQSAD